MTTGYILIVAVLVLGGALATAGDRIGTKVGKARLSLFKLRPRKTATLITVLTGSVVAASTLGILLAADKQLRTGIFELEELQQDLATARKDLERTGNQKNRVQDELVAAREELQGVETQLDEQDAQLNEQEAQIDERDAQLNEQEAQIDERDAQLNEQRTQLNEQRTQIGERDAQLNEQKTQIDERDTQLNERDAQLAQIIAQEERLRSAIDTLQSERQQLVRRNEERVETLRSSIGDLQSERQQLLRRNEEQIEIQKQQLAELEEREQQLRQQDRLLEERESLLADLENQRSTLAAQVGTLENSFRLLRERRVAIGRGQVLTSGVVRIVESGSSQIPSERAISQILREANHVATQLTRPGTTQEDPIIKVAQAEFEASVEEIQNGDEYVVRILSAGNYILGESEVNVTIEVTRNQLIYDEGEPIAEVSVDTSTMSDDEILERIEFLIEASILLASQEGILAERIQIADNRSESTSDFIKALQEQQMAVEVRAIATGLTYTAGPLNLKLVAVQNGEVILETS
ncbi:MAG: DUF3084 domain-containing protein [Cyanobacteriota bacterium]|nr:DUF3084 domain-containing protein [Cyanobacteriota bacterium]